MSDHGSKLVSNWLRGYAMIGWCRHNILYNHARGPTNTGNCQAVGVHVVTADLTERQQTACRYLTWNLLSLPVRTYCFRTNYYGSVLQTELLKTCHSQNASPSLQTNFSNATK